MKYPCLIRTKDCKTPVHLIVETEGINEYGEPITAIEEEVMCNYQDSAKTILTADKKLVQISGTALIPGDIAPEFPVISGGSAIINGVERRIFQGIRARNPDGSTNFVELRFE